ncbi:flagellar M-ring protein FliF [Clostridium cavendishii DSM 21758]|uniref:Flagellar M-ring protein n=1 Tax=Clostridium cavendishii DSM 21758 TaxID=1121302 RepID=A0A1M6AW23_9CLOT|nr:flagellar basal-body MS-ring/collar protein FliF [Clostridium cavendishii]SHI40518.1 flagellar M-ring protein FliF [Clostridium cavendishii DSM 21758]
MDKLKEGFKKIKEKFKALSKGAKIAILVSFLAVIIAIITFVVYSNNNKYKILFSNLDPKDAQTITAKLKEQKVDMKINGNSIMVPKEQVDELRLSLASEVTSGSQGYELMDSGNSFGMTDEEFKIKKQRMQEGELEKTIKSFSQVENARVHETPATDSVFVKDKKPGKASVYLALKAGQKLTDDQVRSIVSLVSGATENIPKENIEVIDGNMNLLSKGLFDKTGDTQVSSSSVEKQQGLQQQYEQTLSDKVNELLVPVIGKDKVKATVNAVLDFDSKEKTQVVVDPNKVIKSQHTIKNNNSNSGGTNSQSPVDNNMSNTISNGTSTNQNVSEDDTTEYQIGQTETKTISAPGEVKRVTASVVVDGKLDDATTQAIKNIVGTAIGYKEDRGDSINVLGIAFDPAQKDAAQKELDQLNQETANAKKAELIKMVVAGVIALIVIIIVVIIIIKKRKPKQEEKEEHILDVVVNNNITPKEVKTFDPIDFDVQDEKSHLENEIKKYATDKPDQVADIIKSWMSESER